MFLGGAAGSSVAMAAWHQGGWLVVGGIASALAIMALLAALMKTKKA